ncbi:hypothetical protein NCG89_04400 [Spongiibacter taiwanensis]|uniref:hypothetical protein n=1 Tax=Spongiibacter taiwanensis TaxID=1748242 RepID=UPI002035A568|nr:hypothetical protein [Spongiibacter taiwanensis]USA44024.1 hypothetical protein NCG89_04400 [Spongiibacter taiwanensis]
MFLFSVNAVSKSTQGDFKEGEDVPFIVYIHFADLFGAEQLAKLLVMREGFRDVKIEKRKHLDDKVLMDNDSGLGRDPQIQEALKKGYCIQAFSAH